MIPPAETVGFASNFSIREISQKSRFFCRDSVGGRAKNEIIFEKFRFYMVGIFFFTTKVTFFNGKMGQNGQKWSKYGMPKGSKKGQKGPQNALKCVQNMLKMVEAPTKYPGKALTCLQKVCMAVCEHDGTATSEKYVFDRLCQGIL